MTRACDLCGETTGTEIEPGIVVCSGCGFVYVPERRPPQEIAAAWGEVYRSGAYDPNWPGVKARLYYVAEWLDQKIGLEGKTVLDIGAGRGFFLEQVKARDGHPVGLEPDPDNANWIRSKDIACFTGAIEDFPGVGQYDLVTILWTLENCGDCLAMLRFARDALAPGGHVVVATGSRIMVPFKKLYSPAFGKLAPDLHCFRWSQKTLGAAMIQAGLFKELKNDYWQNDVLLRTASRREVGDGGIKFADDAQDVIDFFRSWKEIFP